MKTVIAVLALTIGFATQSFASEKSLRSNDKVDQARILECARYNNIIAKYEKGSCFAFGQTPDVADTVSLYEIHNKKCGGDPNIYHSRADFSIRNWIENGRDLGLILGSDDGVSGWQPCLNENE